MININKYEVIVLILCSYYGMSYEEFKKRLKKKDNLYLTLLLMKKFKCLNSEVIQENLGILNNRMLCYRMKKAEEGIDFKNSQSLILYAISINSSSLMLVMI